MTSLTGPNTANFHKTPGEFDFAAPSKNSYRKTRNAGEFEMPLVSNYGEEKNPQKIDSKDRNYLLAANIANGFNVVASGISAFAHAVFHNDISKAKPFEAIASLGAKLSMGANSLYNIYIGHKQKDISIVTGYIGEALDALLAPYNVMGLIRGVTFGTYQTPNILASLGSLEKHKTYSENFSMLKTRLSQGIKKLFSMDTYKNFSENFGIVTGLSGIALSWSGIFAWMLTGSTKLGGFLKGIGEILVDMFQILPKQHRERKRTYYISSGYAFIMGSLAELLSKIMGNEPVTRDLYFFASGIGRMLFTWSNLIGERNYPVGGPANLNNQMKRIAS